MAALATIVCVLTVGFLLAADWRANRGDRISWAPFAWMFLAGSRFASSWLNLRAPASVDAYSEGSPVDRAVFFALIAWGVLVLVRRDIRWGALLRSNKWLVAYLAYCLLSIVWTDEPMVLAKRWLKDLGNPIMALVLLTENKPYDAIVKTARRLAFVLFPLSVLFIRYIPELGRGYSIGGVTTYTGVSDQKNTLGLLCLLVGTCSAWTFLFRRELTSRYEMVTGLMLVWLMYMADSKTSTTCLMVAIAIFVAATRPTIRRRPGRIATASIAAVVLYELVDGVFQVQNVLLLLLGRDPTFTHRTELWAAVSAFQTNALVGTGFMTFWSGDRMAGIWKVLGPGINQAHNGYLEQFLNLGYVGVAFIALIAIFGLRSVYRQLRTNYESGVLRLSFIAMALLYNYTEASFYGINNMWLLFLIGSISVPPSPPALQTAAAVAVRRPQLRWVPPPMRARPAGATVLGRRGMLARRRTERLNAT